MSIQGEAMRRHSKLSMNEFHAFCGTVASIAEIAIATNDSAEIRRACQMAALIKKALNMTPAELVKTVGALK